MNAPDPAVDLYKWTLWNQIVSHTKRGEYGRAIELTEEAQRRGERFPHHLGLMQFRFSDGSLRIARMIAINGLKPRGPGSVQQFLLHAIPTETALDWIERFLDVWQISAQRPDASHLPADISKQLEAALERTELPHNVETFVAGLPRFSEGPSWGAQWHLQTLHLREPDEASELLGFDSEKASPILQRAAEAGNWALIRACREKRLDWPRVFQHTLPPLDVIGDLLEYEAPRKSLIRQIDRAEGELLGRLLVAKMGSVSCEEAEPIFKRCIAAELETSVVMSLLEQLRPKFGAKASMGERRAIFEVSKLLLTRYSEETDLVATVAFLIFVNAMFSRESRPTQFETSASWEEEMLKSPWWPWAQREALQILEDQGIEETASHLVQLGGMSDVSAEEWADLAVRAERGGAKAELLMMLFSKPAFARRSEEIRRASLIRFAEQVAERGGPSLIAALGLLKHLQVPSEELKGVFQRRRKARAWFLEGTETEGRVVGAWAESYGDLATAEELPLFELPEGPSYSWIPDSLRNRQLLVKAHRGDPAALAWAQGVMQQTLDPQGMDLLFTACCIGTARQRGGNLLDLLSVARTGDLVSVERAHQIADCLDQLGVDTRTFRRRAELDYPTAREPLCGLLGAAGANPLEVILLTPPDQVGDDAWSTFGAETDEALKQRFVHFALQHTDRRWSRPPADAFAYRWLSDPAQFASAMEKWGVSVPQLAQVLRPEMALDQLGDPVVQDLVPLLMRQKKWDLLTSLLEKNSAACSSAQWTQRPPAAQIARIATAYLKSSASGDPFFRLMKGHVPQCARDEMRALEFQLAAPSQAPRFFKGTLSQPLRGLLLGEIGRKLQEPGVTLEMLGSLLGAVELSLVATQDDEKDPLLQQAILLSMSILTMLPEYRAAGIEKFMSTGESLRDYKDWPPTRDHVVRVLADDGGEEELEMLCRVFSIAACSPQQIARLAMDQAKRGAPLPRVLHLLTSAPPEQRAEIAREFAGSCLGSDLPQTYKQGALALLLASDQPLPDGVPRRTATWHRGADALLKEVKGQTPSAESQCVAAMAQLLQLTFGEHRYWCPQPIPLPEPLLPPAGEAWVQEGLERGLRLGRAHAGDAVALEELDRVLRTEPTTQSEKALFGSAWGARFIGLARDIVANGGRLRQIVEEVLVQERMPPWRVGRFILRLEKLLGVELTAELSRRVQVVASEKRDAAADGTP